MKKNTLLFAVLASTAILTVNVTHAETLKESVDQALAAHPSVETALAQKVVAQEEYKESRSGLFPEISANASAGRLYSDNSTSRGLTVSRGAAYSWLGEASAAVTQPLFDGMETFNRMDAAEARSESADFKVVDVQQNLAISAVQVHLGVMQAKEILEKTKSYYDVIEDYLGRIELMVDEGVADEAEAAQAKNISLMLKSTFTDYEGQLQSAYASYREITGTMPKSDLIKPPNIFSMIEEKVEEAIRLAKTEHPLVLSGLKDLDAAGYDVKAEQGAYLPEVDGELSYLKRDQKEEIGGELEDARALIKLSWEFETGGAQSARTKQRRAQYSEIISQNSETVRVIEGDIRRAYSEYETAKKQVELVRKREIVTEDLFEAYKTQFEGARVRLLQLMQAENQLFNAQLERITAQYRYLSAQYTILASTGQLINAMSNLPAISIERATKTEAVSQKNSVNTVVEKPKEPIVSSADEELAEKIIKTVK